MNNHWQAVSNAFRPGANKAVNDLIHYIFQTLSDLVPLSESFKL